MDAKWTMNDKAFTLVDWLSPEETQKLLEVLGKDKGRHNNLVISSDLYYDYYYVNTDFVFRRARISKRKSNIG